MKKEHVILVLAFLAGVALSGKVRQLPVLNKLPVF